MLTVVPGDGSGHEDGKGVSPSLIDEIVREGARRMLAEALQVWGAEDKDHALAAIKAFDAAYGAKFPKATAKITDDTDVPQQGLSAPDCGTADLPRQPLCWR